MTELEQLNERIAQLSELVKTGSEAIKSMKTALEAAEEERDRLAEQRKEQEPKFKRVENGEYYWTVGSADEYYWILGPTFCNTENYDRYDDICFNKNNYFHTEKRAQEVADKIKFLLKLERLHDIYCHDYTPDWNDGKWKYFVAYDNIGKRYEVNLSISGEHKTNVFFATKEIAQKACDILNAELEEKE